MEDFIPREATVARISESLNWFVFNLYSVGTASHLASLAIIICRMGPDGLL